MELAALNEIGSLSAGSWQSHKEKGTGQYEGKRALLAQARERHGLRWPAWLGTIQAALPPTGTTPSARHQTMFKLELAACGFGFTHKDWPEGALTLTLTLTLTLALALALTPTPTLTLTLTLTRP